MISMAYQKYRAKAGFTLIEILVTLAIMAVALVPIFYLFSRSAEAESAARFYTVAPLLANEKAASLRSGLANDRYHDSGDFEAYPGYRWQVAVSGVNSETLGKAARDLKQIEVTVSWESTGWEYRVRTYAFLP